MGLWTCNNHENGGGNSKDIVKYHTQPSLSSLPEWLPQTPELKVVFYGAYKHCQFHCLGFQKLRSPWMADPRKFGPQGFNESQLWAVIDPLYQVNRFWLPWSCHKRTPLIEECKAIMMGVRETGDQEINWRWFWALIDP